MTCVLLECKSLGCSTLGLQIPSKKVRSWGVFRGLSTFLEGIWSPRANVFYSNVMKMKTSCTNHVFFSQLYLFCLLNFLWHVVFSFGAADSLWLCSQNTTRMIQYRTIKNHLSTKKNIFFLALFSKHNTTRIIIEEPLSLTHHRTNLQGKQHKKKEN